MVTCMQSIRIFNDMSELLGPQLLHRIASQAMTGIRIGEPQLEDVAEWVSRCGISIPLAESGAAPPIESSSVSRTYFVRIHIYVHGYLHPMQSIEFATCQSFIVHSSYSETMHHKYWWVLKVMSLSCTGLGRNEAAAHSACACAWRRIRASEVEDVAEWVSAIGSQVVALAFHWRSLESCVSPSASWSASYSGPRIHLWKNHVVFSIGKLGYRIYIYVATRIQSIEFLHVNASQNCTTSTDGYWNVMSLQCTW